MLPFKRALYQLLIDHLKKERDVILSGRLEELAALDKRKIQLLERLETEPITDTDQLTKLKQEFSQNQSLLEAAAEGVKSSIERLQSMKDASKSLNTYNSAGIRRTRSTKQPQTFDGRR